MQCGRFQLNIKCKYNLCHHTNVIVIKNKVKSILIVLNLYFGLFVIVFPLSLVLITCTLYLKFLFTCKCSARSDRIKSYIYDR